MSSRDSHQQAMRVSTRHDDSGPYRVVFEHSNDAILVVDPENDRILDVNPRACEMLGYSRPELLELRMSAIHPNEMDKVVRFARAVFDRGYGWTDELTCRTKDGVRRPAELSASVFLMGESVFMIAMVRDITKRNRAERALVEALEQLEKANEELERLATTDALTGIANRRGLNQRLELEWRRAVRNGAPISLLLIDIDLFKEYNDHYGHSVGDEVLKRVARTLSKNLRRPTDFVARYGGEEFVVLLSESSSEASRSLAEKLRTSVAELAVPHEPSEVSECLTVSIGVATILPSDSDPRSRLFEVADRMLYESKRGGRNRSTATSLNRVDDSFG